MKGLINEEIVTLTEEQIKELGLDQEIVKTPTDKDRISALEGAVADLAMMITGVSSNE